MFDAAKSAPFLSSTNATLQRCNLSPATPTVFRNSFITLSLALKDEEDHCSPFACVNQTSPQQQQASEAQDVSFQAQDICYTYQETISQCWNKIQPFLHGETVISYGQCKWHGFQFLPKNIMAEIANHSLSPTTLRSHRVLANHLGRPPHAPYTFHIHLCSTRHVVH